VTAPDGWKNRRGRVLPALSALLLAVAGVLEFGIEDRVIWLAVIFWLLAAAAVIIAISRPVPRSSREPDG
jgi:hypothetical protein